MREPPVPSVDLGQRLEALDGLPGNNLLRGFIAGNSSNEGGHFERKMPRAFYRLAPVDLPLSAVAVVVLVSDHCGILADASNHDLQCGAILLRLYWSDTWACSI